MKKSKWIRKIIKITGMMFYLFFFFATWAWAGDCSGPDDCGGNRLPDNFTRTVGAGGVITGVALALRGTDDSNDEDPPEKKDDEGDAIDIGGGGKKTADSPKKDEKSSDEGDAIDI